MSHFEGPFGAYRFDFGSSRDLILEKRRAAQKVQHRCEQQVWVFAGDHWLIAEYINRNTVQLVLLKYRSVRFFL